MKDIVKIGQLTPDEMSASYRVDSLDRAEKEIRFLIEKLHGVARLSLAMIFEIGRRLVAVKESLDHGQFIPWLSQNFTLTDRTAQKYMRLYEHFRGEPSALLSDLSIQEAYVMAGVVKTVADDAPENDLGPVKFAGKRDLEAERANMVAVFQRPTVSGKDLKNHRVENLGGQIYVYRKDVGTVAPAMDLYLGRPQGLPELDWVQMQESFVIATELYLAKIEAYEREGRLDAPEDLRMLSVMQKKGAIAAPKDPQEDTEPEHRELRKPRKSRKASA